MAGFIQAFDLHSLSCENRFSLFMDSIFPQNCQGGYKAILSPQNICKNEQKIIFYASVVCEAVFYGCVPISADGWLPLSYDSWSLPLFPDPGLIQFHKFKLAELHSCFASPLFSSFPKKESFSPASPLDFRRRSTAHDCGLIQVCTPNLGSTQRFSAIHAPTIKISHAHCILFPFYEST